MGSSRASWKISLRFFSPPEKPLLTARCSSSSFRSQHRQLLPDQFQERHRVQLRFAARFALGVQGGAQEIGVVHAGDFHRILEGQEHAERGALFRSQSGDVLAVEQDFAAR